MGNLEKLIQEVQRGDLDAVRAVLETDRSLVHQTDNSGATALDRAKRSCFRYPARRRALGRSLPESFPYAATGAGYQGNTFLRPGQSVGKSRDRTTLREWLIEAAFSIERLQFT